VKSKAADFWVPRPVIRKRNEPELVAAYRRERWRKRYEENYASLHWCEWDNTRPDGEEIFYGPSIDTIMDRARRTRATRGDEFDPEFRLGRRHRGYTPLDFNE